MSPPNEARLKKTLQDLSVPSLSFFPSHFALKEGLHVTHLSGHHQDTTCTWMSSAANCKGREDMPSFPQSFRNNRPDWNPSTSKISSVRHKPKSFWHINTDLRWKNGHRAITRMSTRSVSLLCSPGRLWDWLNPFTWKTRIRPNPQLAESCTGPPTPVTLTEMLIFQLHTCCLHLPYLQ